MSMDGIDLKRFCAKEAGRTYDTRQPWVHNGWRYAGDSAIVVRIPAVGEPETQPPDGRKFPNDTVEALFVRFPVCTTRLPKLIHQDCPYCGESLIVDMLVGHRLIAGKYLELMAELPGLRLSLDGDERFELCFRAGKLQGVVAPLVNACVEDA